MKTTIQMTDDIYDAYTSAAEGMAGLGKTLTPEEIMVDRLARFKDISPSDRVIVVDPKVRNRLEEILSGGSLKDAEDLLKKVEGLADIRIGEIRIEFTPAELRKMKHWATKGSKGHKAPEEALKDIVQDTMNQIKSQLLEITG